MVCAATARPRGGLKKPLNKFKAALFVLLAANTLFFAVDGTPSKAIDAAAWLLLLVLFTAETTFGERLRHRFSQLALRGMRLVAAAGVFAATIGYVFEENRLDAVNAALWILVVILLEAELRWPAIAARHALAFKAAAVVLFGSLALLVVLWAAYGMWFDAYDAVLWLFAFVTIELEIVRREGESARAASR